MATMPIYGKKQKKKLKNLLLQNHKGYMSESWIWHRGLNSYKIYSKDDAGITFDLFMAKVKFLSPYIYMGKNL